MIKECPQCRFITPTGGCDNHEKAGDNAGSTKDSIVNQPWSCLLLKTSNKQKDCPGYEPEAPVPTHD